MISLGWYSLCPLVDSSDSFSLSLDKANLSYNKVVLCL